MILCARASQKDLALDQFSGPKGPVYLPDEAEIIWRTNMCSFLLLIVFQIETHKMFSRFNLNKNQIQEPSLNSVQPSFTFEHFGAVKTKTTKYIL